jgi:hypothetical protein
MVQVRLHFETSDKLEADLLTDEVKNLTSRKSIRGTALSDQLLVFLEAGNMLNQYCKLLSKEPKEA